MITLFIDTSSSDVSIALVKDDLILDKIVESIPNKHSVYTVSYIDKVLKNSRLNARDVDRIMVVNGPGSFTGVRIGVTIAKVYAYLEEIQIICISSLKMRTISSNGNHYILSLIDAHHNHYYMGLYDKDYNEIIKEGFYHKEDVLKVMEKYHPLIVSDMDICVDEMGVGKQELDIVKVVDYYKNHESMNPHLVNPNYLKLPQALEELK